MSSRPSSRRQSRLSGFFSRGRSPWRGSNVDRILDAKRGYGRRLFVEALEDRRMMAIVTVSNNTDVNNGDTTSIATLIATPGADGISLREAIVAANNTLNAPAGTPDEIRFAIGAGGLQTIQPTMELPAITDAVLINGYTQPGASPGTFTTSLNATLAIQLDGTLAGAGADGLQINATGSGSTIRGLAINRFTAAGIHINAADNNIIAGNFIGTNVAGNADLGNVGDGVFIEGDSSGNTVGGTLPADRNLISGNGAQGIEISGMGASSNLVRGNLIGTNADGTGDLGNSANGIFITNSATLNAIGDANSLARNIISGNDLDGVFIGAGTGSNIVVGNYIGTTVAGTAALGNGFDGVDITNSSSNTVGGTIAGAGNVISSNGDDGVEIFGAMSTNNSVVGNFIGTNFAGGMDLGNAGEGVAILSMASGNTVGGAIVGAANIIANNNDGVTVEGDGADNNRIQRNSIFDNDDLGIDLDDNGVTANDANDADEIGGNRLQNFPVFVGNATLLGNSIALTYRVDTAVANATYPLTVEFFVADGADQEGRTFLAQDTYAAGQAQANKQIIIPAPALLTNQQLVATATDAAGNTSEFSLPLTIALPVILGSEPTIIRNGETITGSEIDLYQYIAHSTGKLHVRIDFLHDFGNLDLEVRDQFGNLLAPTASNSTSDDNFEEIIIPVVAQQRYFIRVFGVGFTPDQMNTYNLEVENFPAPVPSGIHLDPLSDTGMMNNDNVTSDTTPTFFIQTDVLNFVDTNGNLTYQEPDTFPPATEDKIDALTPAEANALLPGAPNPDADDMDGGVAVEITLTNTTDGVTVVTGFAEAVVGVVPEVYRFTPTAPLTPGVYLVTSRTRVFDGQLDAAGNPAQRSGRSNASPPLWVTISADSPAGGTFDLLASSDTGMFNDDNVTNKMQPAFGGQGPANAKVNVFAQLFNAAGMPVGSPLLVGNGVVGSDGTDGMNGNGLGLWEVTVEPMADGKYNFFAQFETAAGVIGDPVALGQNFAFAGPVAIPDNATINVPINVPAGMATISDLNVAINLTHTRDEDLDIFLIAPNGTEIELSTDNGGASANYTNTIFDDASGNLITAGVAPFTGIFRPEENLAQLNGLPIAGMWTLRIVDDTMNEQMGQLLSWNLNFQTPLMVVIDTVEPNTPFLDLLDDTGRHNADNITKDNTPMVSMTTTDPNIAFSQLLFTDNLKFRIFDRYQNSATEVLIYDSAVDMVADNFMTPADMFTAFTQLTRTLPVLTPVNPAIVGGALADGVHNLKLEVEDRAGNISHDFILQITVDTTTPPVSFGLPDAASMIDGLAAESDSGVTTVPATFADRVTSDTTPRLWGRAEADSIVRVWLDRNNNGIIDLLTDTFLGQQVAIPFDGNDAYPDGYWELTSVRDLNEIVGLPKDGLRRLLVTAEDVAGNPMPMANIIAAGVDELQIFIDTQGPRITNVTPNDVDFDLFDPKPSLNGPTPLVDSLKISLSDPPDRLNQPGGTINDFLYDAVVAGVAQPGNFLLVGDHVGQIAIESITVMQAPLAAALTAVASATQFTAASLIGADIDFGDFVLFTSGMNDNIARQVTAFNSATGQITVSVAFPNVPVVGDLIRVADTEAEARTAATAMVILNFFDPLPDDRYTLTVRENVVDPAGNILDGESNFIEPSGVIVFPSGNAIPGGNFVARFTIDSRPEIGSYVAQAIHIDINGNFVWDPANGQIGNDATNVDISFTLPVQNPDGTIGLGGYNVHDLLVAGKFTPLNGNNNGNQPAAGAGVVLIQSFFDQLAAYGNSAELGAFRWIIDTNSDGVVNEGDGDVIVFQGTLAGFNSTARAGAIPVAGNFDRNGSNGDEIGLYYAGIWALDTNHDYIIDRVFTGNLLGAPIVGDFDGNGVDDLGVFNNNQFFFDLSFNSLAHSTATVDTSFIWGFPGVLDKPVAADMDQDGIDDIGLWVPRTSANPPRIIAEWYFLVSDDFDPTPDNGIDNRRRIAGQVNTLNHAFTPVPFGADLFAEFGDELALPIVGNFDPPVAKAAPGQSLVGDYDDNGIVEMADKMVWRATFGSSTNMAADGNHDGRIDVADYVVWRKNLGATAGAGSGSISASTAAADSSEFTSALLERNALIEGAASLSVALGGSEEVAKGATVLDGAFARFDSRRPVRAALEPSIAATVALDADDLLLAANGSSAEAAVFETSSVGGNRNRESSEIVDDLLAELADFGGLFESF